MRTARERARKGTAVIEFTLAGVPLILLLVSTIEMARGMWLYHTLTYSVKEGTRYSIVHGQNCSLSPNSCTVTLGQVATQIRNAAVGLTTSQMSLTFTTMNGSTTCTLNNCLTNTNTFPASPGNAPGMDVTITGTYPYSSLIMMFWPGASPHQDGKKFGNFTFSASSREKIQF